MERINERNIALCIVLSIITCGIYNFVWMAIMNDDINEILGAEDETSGGMVVLFSIITCGIYTIYWLYKMGEKITAMNSRYSDYSGSNNSIVYLLLGIFGLSIISYALMQSEINKYINTFGPNQKY